MATVQGGSGIRAGEVAGAIAAVITLLTSTAVPANASDPVTEWNRIAAQKTLTASPPHAPVQQTRDMAIVQVSVHDAVNGITGAFRTYAVHGPAPAGASPEAAAIAAADEALRSLFPGPASESALDAAYAASLSAHGIWDGDPGLAFGRTVADEILALRAGDGAAQAQFDYVVPNGGGAPGVWERLGGAAALLPAPSETCRQDEPCGTRNGCSCGATRGFFRRR